MYMCVVGMYAWEHVATDTRPEVGVRSSEGGVIGGGEPPSIVAEIQMQTFWKSNTYS